MNLIKIDFNALPEISRIYVGANNACRCGCKGAYHEPGSAGFKRALNKAIKLGLADDVCESYINFPYGNNRAVTLYFD